jgi:MFS family permease
VILNRIAVKTAFFLNGFVYANWASRLPRIQDHYHLHNSTIALVLLSMSIGAVGAMPFTGWVIIKHGSRKITLLSILFYCILVPLIPLMPGFIALIILYLLMGITMGTLDVAMNAQAVMVEQQYRKPILTSFHALFSIGMAAGAWCGSLFSELDYGLSRHLTIITILSIAAAFWASRNLVKDVPVANDEHGPLFRIPNKAIFAIGVIAFCCMMAEGAMSDWTANFMEKVAHSAKAIAPLGLSAFATAMTIGRLFGDRARAGFGDEKLIVIGGIISTAGLSLALIFASPFIAIAGFFLVGIGLSVIVPIAYSIAGNTKGLPSGVGLAMVTTVGYTGFLFGPPIIGFISDIFDLRIGLCLIVILLSAMTLLGYMRGRRQRSELL